MHDPSAMIRAFGLHATADHVSFLAAENARLTALAAELAEALQAIHTGHASADYYRDHFLRRDDVRVLLDREDQAQ